MMSLPFFGLCAALGFAWAGRRAAALVLWAVSIGFLLLLFRLHATDPLNLML